MDEMKGKIERLIMKTKKIEEIVRKNQLSVTLQKESSILPDMDKQRQALNLVFPYLDVRSLINTSQVSPLWRECSVNPKLWSRVIISSQKCTSNALLAKVAQFCSQTHTIVLKNLRSTQATQEQNFGSNLEPGLEVILRASGNNLKTFAVIDCDVLFTNRVAWLISNHCRQVINFVYISNIDCVNSEMIWSLGAGCRGVKTLIIPPILPMNKSFQLTNRCLRSISTVFPHLQMLCIGGHEIDRRGLTSIANNCRQLHTLELDHSGEVRYKTAVDMCANGLNNLKILCLTFTSITPKAILEIYRNCSKLQNIMVQLNFFVYFKTNTKENINKYRKRINNIDILTKHSKLGRVLFLKADILEC